MSMFKKNEIDAISHSDQPWLSWFLEGICVKVLVLLTIRAHKRGDDQTFDRLNRIIQTGSVAEQLVILRHRLDEQRADYENLMFDLAEQDQDLSDELDFIPGVHDDSVDSEDCAECQRIEAALKAEADQGSVETVYSDDQKAEAAFYNPEAEPLTFGDATPLDQINDEWPTLSTPLETDVSRADVESV